QRGWRRPPPGGAGWPVRQARAEASRGLLARGTWACCSRWVGPPLGRTRSAGCSIKERTPGDCAYGGRAPEVRPARILARPLWGVKSARRTSPLERLAERGTAPRAGQRLLTQGGQAP